MSERRVVVDVELLSHPVGGLEVVHSTGRVMRWALPRVARRGGAGRRSTRATAPGTRSSGWGSALPPGVRHVEPHGLLKVPCDLVVEVRCSHGLGSSGAVLS